MSVTTTPAADRLADLEKQVRAGENVSPTALAKAKGEAELEALRADGAAQRAAAEAEEARQQAIAAAVTDLERGEFGEQVARILEAHDAAVSALVHLAEQCSAYAAAQRAMAARLIKLSPLPPGVSVAPGGTITHEGRSYPRARDFPQRAAFEAVAEALTEIGRGAAAAHLTRPAGSRPVRALRRTVDATGAREGD